MATQTAAAKPTTVTTTTGGVPQPEEHLADVIRRIGDSFARLQRSGLNRRAIVVLLHDDCKVGKRDIEAVLSSLGTLAKQYAGPKS